MIELSKYTHLSGLRVKFFTRSFSLELYRLSSALYAEAELPCVRLTDQTADGYFFTMLADTDCDVAINVDEDCFITDLDAVLRLADRTVGEGFVNVGCSDAAKGCPRVGNAEVTNPFFNVFNLALIRTEWKGKSSEQELQARTTDCEPYYPFFFWLVTHFPQRTCYLDNSRHPDGLSTQLFDAQQTRLCLHTWFARFYHPSWLTYCFEGSEGKKHTSRIDAIIDEAYAARGIERPLFGLSDRLAFALNSLERWTVKVPQRIAKWPQKLKRRFWG